MIPGNANVELDTGQARNIASPSKEPLRRREPVSLWVNFFRLLFDVVQQANQQFAWIRHSGSQVQSLALRGRLEAGVWQWFIVNSRNGILPFDPQIPELNDNTEPSPKCYLEQHHCRVQVGGAASATLVAV